MSWKGWIGPFAIILAGAVFATVIVAVTPSKWEDAVALKICRDGTPILRLTNGEIWARHSGFRAYRVEDAQSVCG